MTEGFNIPDEVQWSPVQYTNFIIMRHNMSADDQQYQAKETQSIPDINDWFKTLENIYGWAILMYNKRDMEQVSAKFTEAKRILSILNTPPSRRNVHNHTSEIARHLIMLLAEIQVLMRLKLQYRNKFFIKYGYSTQTTTEIMENYFNQGRKKGGRKEKGKVKGEVQAAS